MFEEFKLPPASSENINDWMRAIDGWVESAAGPLAALAAVVLEILLRSEDEVARHLRSGLTPPDAPAPSRVPGAYATLIAGQERKRQKRLGWWDRFQVADGLVPAIARLLVAGAIVGAVLGFGGIAAKMSTLSIYNGLGRTVVVAVGDQTVRLGPFSAGEFEVELTEQTQLRTKTADGVEVETVAPPLGRHSEHYVYNVAGAAPLVEWAATYGSAAEQKPRFLGATRWTTSSADVFFGEPPASVSTKSGGATRWVLVGLGEKEPEEVLKLVRSDEEARQVILAHAKWDSPNSKHAAIWKKLAERL